VRVLSRRFKTATIFRSRRSWTHDDKEGGWSTWSSGKDIGTSIAGNLDETPSIW
jgi:hypothetical protein